MTRVPGGPGTRGPLGDLEDTAIVRKTSFLLETVDIIAADAGSWGAVASRLSSQQQQQLQQQQGPPPGRWGLLPRLCALEDFKDLERRKMTKQLRADHSQSQKEQQQQDQEIFPEAETACVFVSAFIEEATPYLISFVRLLPSLRRLTICSFFSEEQHRWHACCMQQQAGMPVQRLAATLRRQREGLQPTSDGPSGAPKWQGPLEVEVLHTPFHATFLTQGCFLLTESSDVPIICPDSVRRLLSEAAAEESLLQRQPTAAAATAGLDGDVQLDDISLASLPLRHREAYSRLASRLAECCSAWGCSAAAVHCCGAAARLLGRAVAERIPPKPKGASIAAAAAAGEQREREVLLLIVDRLQDLQSPLAPGSLLSPSAPSDGGEWTLQQLKVLQQHKQRQEQPQQPQLVDPSAVPSQLIDSTGVFSDFSLIRRLLNCGSSPNLDSCLDTTETRQKNRLNRKQQQQQEMEARAAGYIEGGALLQLLHGPEPAWQALVTSAVAAAPHDAVAWRHLMGALSAAFYIDQNGEDYPKLEEGSSAQQCRNATLLRLLQLLQQTRDTDIKWGNSMLALQHRVSLWPLLEFVEHLLLPSLLAGDTLTNLQRAIKRASSGSVPLESLNASLLIAAARASQAGPDAPLVSSCCQQHSRSNGESSSSSNNASSCKCWECLLREALNSSLSRNIMNNNASSKGSSSKAKAIAHRLWCIQQSRSSLTNSRMLPVLPSLDSERCNAAILSRGPFHKPHGSFGYLGGSSGDGQGAFEGMPASRDGLQGNSHGPQGNCWLLSLARSLGGSDDASSFAEAPPAQGPLLEDFIKKGLSTVNFLWVAAKERAGASWRQKETPKGVPSRSVVTFVLGGLAPKELQAFTALNAAHGNYQVGANSDVPSYAQSSSQMGPFLVGSTCLTSPTSLAAQLFGDLTGDLQTA